MKAPLSWLREYVTIESSVDELASRLALTGTEVERVSQVGVAAEDENLSRFVVGKVCECSRHPNADRLSVCVVDVGEGEPRTIVCGASNVATGQTVAVVLPGGIMPDGTRIKEAKLRGVTSSGMIMSELELGLAGKSEGIMVLPDSWNAGDGLATHFPISDDVLEVEVTPNRPDCLSIRGLAREIAAISGVPFEERVETGYPTGDRSVHDDIGVVVADPHLCPRYMARVIRGVRVGPSPLWLKARIAHAGMRSVNNVVDVTNYVLWALGQPLHAFDLRTVRGGQIIVRRASAGETITTLDDEERILTEDMLVIADTERALVVAGVMGGLNSEVTDATTDILLEGATFFGPSVMRTSAALGLRSESSTRYEKGLDPEMVPAALDMACRLLVDVCGGVVSAGTVDERAPARPRTVLALRPDRVARTLGVAVPPDEMSGILTCLGCDVGESDDGFRVSVPSFRADLSREIDLIEEIARIYGLDRIPSTLPARRSGRGGLNRRQTVLRQIEDLLVGAGLAQVITYSFEGEKWLKRLRLDPDDERRAAIVIANPLSIEQSRMRRMLLPGLLDTVRANQAVREYQVALFEVGRVFHPAQTVLPEEQTKVGIVVAGEGRADSWLSDEQSVDYYHVKGLVERLEAGLRCRLRYSPATEPFLHPGKSAIVQTDDGRYVGWLGEVHPLVLQEYDLRPETVVAAELDLDALVAAASLVPEFVDLLAYPAVEQDLALVVDADVPASEVIEQIRIAGGELLADVAVFDLYQGAQVGEGKKSLALRLSFRSPERTLNDAEVNEVRAAILSAVGATLGAQLRS
ncbi:MAG: phenylalanine--tRNA ligase subunit beta [Thermoleophilia bacterium]|jgi:phenylalanyl-tRNA synthetase beta chain